MVSDEDKAVLHAAIVRETGLAAALRNLLQDRCCRTKQDVTRSKVSRASCRT